MQPLSAHDHLNSNSRALPAAGCVWGVLHCQVGIGSVSGLGGYQHNPALFPSVQHLRRKSRAKLEIGKNLKRNIKSRVVDWFDRRPHLVRIGGRLTELSGSHQSRRLI